MRISHRYRFVFFANPKTGSSSVRQFLNPWADVLPVRDYRERTADNPFYPHITPLEAQGLFAARGWDFAGYTKFVLVRNPWARLVSLYRHVCEIDPATPGFFDWLFTTEPHGRGGGGEDWQRWRRYGAWSIAHYIGDGAGGTLVDHVLRLEDIATTLKPFLEGLGLPVAAHEIPHSNRRADARPYTSWYTPAAAGVVASRYRYDIATFGYRFGD